ncbi:hypothetical protein KL86DES1_10453 [uncultured Desulfovibrio sp.]|jgi:hypothetical protein|uniref:Uncharacterized protein n=1 Tax=uncultured Desulfovibrio sp. TaxID=167968 RepID=A0A212KYX3_9BACT|nr:hypothetical protein KL86DES1_10453 [uncultured Desulfovibrio sp.]VZH32327.1 conserved protein of unknown function [Desulfovibrio sp. 86]
MYASLGLHDSEYGAIHVQIALATAWAGAQLEDQAQRFASVNSGAGVFSLWNMYSQRQAEICSQGQSALD